MNRREFVALLGTCAAACPLDARGQQAAMPVVGFLRSTPAAPFAHYLEAFRQGLKEEGFVEGESVAIEQRAADDRLDRLPGLAADLVARKVAVIVGNTQAADAAKAATRTMPIVFVTGEDPVAHGFVGSLNRPDGNLTGVVFFAGGHLGAKRLELLHELIPKAAIIAVLMDPKFSQELPAVEEAARALGRHIVVVKAASEGEFDAAFSHMAKAGAGALLVGGGSLFASQRRTLVALALRHRLPAIHDIRDAVVDGALMSYGTSPTGAYRQAGRYVGRILKGANVAELPVMQPTTFELVINMKTAKTLGISLPQSFLLRADELIE